jgi:hypothetical protein
MIAMTIFIAFPFSSARTRVEAGPANQGPRRRPAAANR